MYSSINIQGYGCPVKAMTISLISERSDGEKR